MSCEMCTPYEGIKVSCTFTKRLAYTVFMLRVIYKKLEDIEDPLLSLVPIVGALHVSLNAFENVFIAFNSFFREMYSKFFPNHKPLAEKPKPWRIYFMLEVMEAGQK